MVIDTFTIGLVIMNIGFLMQIKKTFLKKEEGFDTHFLWLYALGGVVCAYAGIEAETYLNSLLNVLIVSSVLMLAFKFGGKEEKKTIKRR